MPECPKISRCLIENLISVYITDTFADIFQYMPGRRLLSVLLQ